jgi:hypothetical protein
MDGRRHEMRVTEPEGHRLRFLAQDTEPIQICVMSEGETDEKANSEHAVAGANGR